MIRLRAYTPDDGWAFVEEDGALVAVRPPYSSLSRTPVPDRTLELAVAAHGFQAADAEFADWADLLTFLQKEVLRRRAETQELPEDSSIREDLMRQAPVDQLARQVQRIESDLIPRGQAPFALALLTDMIGLPQVAASSELTGAIQQALIRAREALAPEESIVSTIGASQMESFGFASERYSIEAVRECAVQISRRGRTLCPVA